MTRDDNACLALVTARTALTLAQDTAADRHMVRGFTRAQRAEVLARVREAREALARDEALLGGDADDRDPWGLFTAEGRTA